MTHAFPLVAEIPMPTVREERRSVDTSRLRVPLRDAIVVLVTIAGMWAVQEATTWGLRSDIQILKQLVVDAQNRQGDANTNMQLQINEWRAETKYNRTEIEAAKEQLSEIKGLVTALGLKQELKK